MITKIKHNSLEILTWGSIILITLIIAFIFPWYTAENILRYLLIVASIIAIAWYLKSRRLYDESIRKTKEILNKQREVQSRQKTIDLIFENSADGILILNEDQRIEGFSPGLENISGYKKEEVLGRLANQVLRFRGDNTQSLLPDLMFLPKNVQKHPYIKNTIITKEGREIDIEASYTSVRDPGKSQIKAMAIIRDVTYENELARRDKEFIAITSHQLNTPLSIIRGYTSIMLNEKAGKITKKQNEYLNEIYNSVKKMISLTSNLLSISRIEQEKIKLVKTDINVQELFETLEKNFSEQMQSKKIKLDFVYDNPKLIIYADQEKIYQAFSNLIDNAIKYTLKGNVKVMVKADNNRVLFTISDTGIGIPKEDIDKIGMKFYRSQSAINIDSKGTGLGLFIAKTIIEKHEGSLSIQSEINKGTKITINLPMR